MESRFKMDPQILVVDDDHAIHQLIGRTLTCRLSAPFAAESEEDFFGDSPTTGLTTRFQIVSAFDGLEALQAVQAAAKDGGSFAMAFVELRLPAPWSGVDTIRRIWAEDPDVQIVVCTGCEALEWSDLVSQLAPADNLLILRKPFDPVEIRQMVHALCAKWILRREVLGKIDRLEHDLESESVARVRVEAELDATQRIGLIGQLATGVARQASVPAACRDEAIHFLRLAFEDLSGLIGHYRHLLIAMSTLHADADGLIKIRALEEAVDLSAVAQRIPQAFEQIADGTVAINALVHAVRDLADGKGNGQPGGVDRDCWLPVPLRPSHHDRR